MTRKALVVSTVIILVAALACAWFLGTTRRGFGTRDKPGSVEVVLATSMRDLAIPSHYKDMRNPVTTNADVIHEGMAHWADHCASCHANNGSGDTMYGRTMYPRPPDMRARDTQAMSDGELYYTIKNGVRLSGMPAFGEPGDNDLDSWKLVTFIRQLPSLSQDEVFEMEKLNPKSPDEMREEQQEEEFLNGSSSSQEEPHNHHKKDQ